MNMPISLDLSQFRASKHNNFVCRVTAVSKLGNSIVQVFLTPPAGFPHYSAGQYIELVLPDGTSRPFSIANFVPGVRSLELHIEINPNSTATMAIIEQLQSQGEIQVKSAKGDVYLKPVTGPQVFLAAGSGFAQIKALMQQFLFNLQHGSNIDSASPAFYLFWGTDTPEQRYMKDLIKVWCYRYENFHYHPLNWQQGDCWESALVPQLHRLIDGHFYACGSPSRVYSTLEFLEQQGLSSSQMQSDVFAYAPRPLKQNAG
jgi:CDP-4-dehydro-6-deoxyglucose reductase